MLAARIAEQDAKLAELTHELTAATSSSQTSSEPPSSDESSKPTTPAPSSARTKTGRRPGGQPGHQGATLHEGSNADVVIHHRPGTCSGVRHRRPMRRRPRWRVRRSVTRPERLFAVESPGAVAPVTR
ncbi:DUF6444 domain-containing protein [Quadrisphaera oryzae]|uniref:DUF6444 domain-containing protein n=1 Tax=Quadrisphaera TaxID=317661 RepID=UPI001C97534B